MKFVCLLNMVYGSEEVTPATSNIIFNGNLFWKNTEKEPTINEKGKLLSCE